MRLPEILSVYGIDPETLPCEGGDLTLFEALLDRVVDAHHDGYRTGFGEGYHGRKTGAREGAARVLSVVSQVAALLQGQRLAWVAGVGERVRAAVDAVPVHDHSRVRMQVCASCGSVEWRAGFAHEWSSFYCRGCGCGLEVQDG